MAFSGGLLPKRGAVLVLVLGMPKAHVKHASPILQAHPAHASRMPHAQPRHVFPDQVFWFQVKVKV